MPVCVKCRTDIGDYPEEEVRCRLCRTYHCPDHVEPEDHDCDQLESEESDEGFEAGANAPVARQQQATGSSDSGSRLIAGAILVAAGGFISLSGVGAIIGVPMMFLGFAVMFPRFTVLMVVLAVLAFFGVLAVL